MTGTIPRSSLEINSRGDEHLTLKVVADLRNEDPTTPMVEQARGGTRRFVFGR